MVAHKDEYSPRCSNTMRTARSRTSGENLFDFFMAPFSQMLEPPQNPGRFNTVCKLGGEKASPSYMIFFLKEVAQNLRSSPDFRRCFQH